MSARHEERPAQGGSWLGNAAVSERSRARCLAEAEAAEARGESEAAQKLRAYAATHRADRDRIQRLELRRSLNRSMALRRRYH